MVGVGPLAKCIKWYRRQVLAARRQVLAVRGGVPHASTAAKYFDGFRLPETGKNSGEG